jgi:hypothetical protein
MITMDMIFSRLIQSILIAGLLFVGGCSSTPSPSTASDNATLLRPLLNSERINLIFGSYGIDVLKSNKTLRVSNLYSRDKNIKTTRTLAVVRYSDTVDPLFSSEHQTILDGGSIGAVFKSGGWKINKQHIYFGDLDSSPKFNPLYTMMGEIPPKELAVHLYALFISKDNAEFRYSLIAETHHPKYLDSKLLEAIYESENLEKQTTSEEIQEILNTVIKEIEQL